jgi:hypothetical protein
MKSFKVKNFIILLLVTTFFVSFKTKEPAVGKISFPLGNVLLLPKGKTRYQKAYLNMPVKNGDKIETKKTARCEITFNDKSVVRIDEQTIYTIEKADIGAEKKEVSSFLFFGKLWANVKKLIAGKDSWKLKSPSAVVAVRGTVYRMNAGVDSSSQVLVYEGNVAVGPASQGTGQQGSVTPPGKPVQVQGPQQIQGPTEVSKEQWLEIVKAQQQIVIKPDGSYAKSDFNMEDDAKLDWVKWNMERDKMLEQQ